MLDTNIAHPLGRWESSYVISTNISHRWGVGNQPLSSATNILPRWGAEQQIIHLLRPVRASEFVYPSIQGASTPCLDISPFQGLAVRLRRMSSLFSHSDLLP